jgi:hypothetical protein
VKVRVDLGRLMVRSAPVQRRFGPSLPALLAPRIGRLPVFARRVGLLIVVALVAAIIARELRGGYPTFSRRSPVAFHLTYPTSLTREPTPRGALLELELHNGSQLLDSYEISPLALPAYSGEISGLLPVIAANYERKLAAQIGPTFVPWSLGRTRIIHTPGFTFTYERTIDGQTYFGRVTFITVDLSGDRHGLMISLLTLPKTLAPLTDPAPPDPDDVGTAGGVLADPYAGLHIGA